MATFNPLYTGVGSAAKFPELDALERSQARAGELAIRGAEQKIAKIAKDKDRFRTLMDIDPIQAVSIKNQLEQDRMLKDYNAKATAMYVRGKGELTEADEAELMVEKAALKAKQGKILADQEQFKTYLDVLKKDTEGYYDRKRLEQGIDKYYKTGELDTNMLIVAPQDINKLLAKDPPQTRTVRSRRVDVTDAKGNIVGKQDVSEEGVRSEEEAKEMIFQKMKYEPVLRFVVEDFLSQDDAETEKFLKEYDRDGNLKIDPQEMEYVTQGMNVRDNPIVQWAMNNPKYLATSMGVNPNVPKGVSTDKANGGGDWSTYYGAGKKTTYQATEARDVGIIGQTAYPKYHDIPNLPVDDVTVQTIRILDPKGEQTIQPKSPIAAEIVGYDEEKDEVIFIATKDFLNLGSGAKYGSGQQSGKDKRFAVKRSLLSDRQKDIYILKDGKRVKIKDLPKVSGGTAKVDIGL